MNSIFRSCFVNCKQHSCAGATRLPRSIPLAVEISQKDLPTASDPMLILCNHCWKISKYMREDFQIGEYPAIALSGDIPFCMVEIVCGEESCGIPTRVYMRDIAAYRMRPDIGIKAVVHALGGIDAVCPHGHSLAKSTVRKEFLQIDE